MARCMGWDVTEQTEYRVVQERCRDVATKTITGDYVDIPFGFCERHMAQAKTIYGWAHDPTPIPADDPGVSPANQGTARPRSRE